MPSKCYTGHSWADLAPRKSWLHLEQRPPASVVRTTILTATMYLGDFKISCVISCVSRYWICARSTTLIFPAIDALLTNTSAVRYSSGKDWVNPLNLIDCLKATSLKIGTIRSQVKRAADLAFSWYQVNIHVVLLKFGVTGWSSFKSWRFFGTPLYVSHELKANLTNP